MFSFSFASVNMRRRNAAMHALLETNSEDDILFVQEPWFNRVGIARSDGDREGRDVLGGAAHNKWELSYPYFSGDQRAKVMTYTRIHERGEPFKKNAIRTTNRLDLVSHPCIQIIDVRVGQENWRVINFYNDVDDHSAMRTLQGLTLDATIPTLMVGDFNMHSRTWSPSGWDLTPRVGIFEEWAAAETFELLTTQGTITRRGTDTDRPSTLDLTWRNLSASLGQTFYGAEVDWAGSLGSDHALIRTRAVTFLNARPPKEERRKGYDLDPAKREEWDREFKKRCPTLSVPPTNAQEINTAVDLLYDAFEGASAAVLDRKGPCPAHSSRWWNDDCAAAVQRVREADEDSAAEAKKNLKTTIRRAKRTWADDYITKANVWEVATWRHGRRQTKIPALRTEDGSLSFEHEDMASTLSKRFFTEDSGDVRVTFDDDPNPVPPRTFEPLTEDELWDLLGPAPAKSAPGVSGIGWELLRWGWPTVSETLTNVFNACISVGHHPRRWKQAIVAVIPKPDKPDYTLAKAHRPISLLENMSKLLEKAVAKRMQHDIVKYELVPTNQFGGRSHSSCVDAGLALVHDIQSAHRARLKCGVLLFDVRGFFDNVNHARLVGLLENLGFAGSMTRWAADFLRERKVRLRFNNILSDERGQPVGVPQGSPISPVLSIVYTSPLLHRMRGWNNSSLGMYVDDGILFACAEEWEEVTRLLQARYRVCEDWLLRAGLAVEPDKTELVFFQRPRERHAVAAPTRLILPDYAANTYYVVQPVETVRYLGFFINRRLNWEPHVKIMCNRARASIKALQILGNSVRGLSMANWRLAYNAVCLPVLTYGCQLWYTGKQKKLVNMLQRVQNEGVKVITGAFRTAPREALLQIAKMLPMRHHLEKLTTTSALRLYRVPRASQLLRRLGPEWYVPHAGDLPLALPARRGNGRAQSCPTALETLSARVPSKGPHIDLTAIAPWEVPNWVNRTVYMGVTAPEIRRAWTQDIYKATEGMSIALVQVVGKLTNAGRDDGKVVGGAAATYTVGGSALTGSAWTMGTDITQFDVDVFGLAKAAESLATFYSADVNPPDSTYIFSNSAPAILAIKNPRNKKAHEHSIMFHQSLTTFCLNHRDARIILVWSPEDHDLEGRKMAHGLAAEACQRGHHDDLNRVQSAAYQKNRARYNAFFNWGTEWLVQQTQRGYSGCSWLPTDFGTRTWVRTHPPPKATPSFAYAHTLTRPPDGKNHPLWRAATERKKDDKGRQTGPPLYSRRTTSTALQLAVDHAFTGTYVIRFRPGDPEEASACPCGALFKTDTHVLYDCPYRLLPVARHLSRMVYNGTKTPYHAIYRSKNSHRLLTFLQKSGALSRPEPGPPPDVPPEPEPD
jgi:hypothetical protein